MVFLLLPAAAFAQTGGTEYPTTPTTPTTEVRGTVVTRGRTGDPGDPAKATLPFTGGDVALLSVLGVGAVASGGAILLFTRRRSSTSSS